MNAIKDDRIKKENNLFYAKCVCGNFLHSRFKNSILRMLNNGHCIKCKTHYKNINNVGFYKVGDKWGKKCTGCGSEQLYTRKDHARQSFISDWNCKKCVAKSKGLSENKPVGDKARIYNKFKKSALKRQINWDLTIDEMYEFYTGYCVMTGWELSLSYENQTASLDRIDSKLGYIKENIQWVHTMVNMTKNKYSQTEFIKMCKAISTMFY